MEKVNNLELLRKINKIVIKEDTKEYTSHILQDWMCSTNKLIDWICKVDKNNPFIIVIRKYGLEAGYENYINERLKVLSNEYIRIIISRIDNENFKVNII